MVWDGYMGRALGWRQVDWGQMRAVGGPSGHVSGNALYSACSL